MQEQMTMVANPPKADPTSNQEKEKVRQLLSNMDLDKASLIVYLQS